MRIASHRRSAAGFSLLEVVLALAILGGALAVLGEVTHNAMRSARMARDLTIAQLYCESKMDEVTSGVILPEAVADVPLDTTDDQSLPDWLYSIEVEDIDQAQGLLAVRVTVAKEVPSPQRPPRFSLTRWVVDPSAQTSTATQVP